MKFRPGDKVTLRHDLENGKEYGGELFTNEMAMLKGSELTIGSARDGRYRLEEDREGWFYTDEMFETQPYMDEPTDNVIRPEHYNLNDKDLFDELYDRLYHSEEIYTGREVFVIVMKFVAERYTRRYPNKNEDDLDKAIYVLQRLQEYEEENK